MGTPPELRWRSQSTLMGLGFVKMGDNVTKDGGLRGESGATV